MSTNSDVQLLTFSLSFFIRPSFLPGKCGHGVFDSFLGEGVWVLVTWRDFFGCTGRWWWWCDGVERIDGMT
jgi:hypothetical protein